MTLLPMQIFWWNLCVKTDRTVMQAMEIEQEEWHSQGICLTSDSRNITNQLLLILPCTQAGFKALGFAGQFGQAAGTGLRPSTAGWTSLVVGGCFGICVTHDDVGNVGTSGGIAAGLRRGGDRSRWESSFPATGALGGLRPLSSWWAKQTTKPRYNVQRTADWSNHQAELIG